MLEIAFSSILLGESPPLQRPKAAHTQVLKESPGEELLREAKLLRYAQRYYEAGALYRRYLKEFTRGSRLADAQFWLAATLEQDQRWDEAAQAYGTFLNQHPDQRLLSKEAKLNRIRCWGIRQGQSPEAIPGLMEAMEDPNPEIQVAAALQLAKRKEPRAVPALQKGLYLPQYADASSLALCGLGVKPDPSTQARQSRFLVIRIQETGKREPVTIRLAMGFARLVENYLSEEQLRKVRSKGMEPNSISDAVMKLPKGTVLFSVEDSKSSVTVTVE